MEEERAVFDWRGQFMGGRVVRARLLHILSMHGGMLQGSEAAEIPLLGDFSTVARGNKTVSSLRRNYLLSRKIVRGVVIV